MDDMQEKARDALLEVIAQRAAQKPSSESVQALANAYRAVVTADGQQGESAYEQGSVGVV